MTVGKFFSKVFSARLLANILAMALFIVLLCVAARYAIDSYTRHGETVTVPDIRHKRFSDARHLLQGQELGIAVNDTGYVKTLPADCILDQVPAPGRVVKPGRTVRVVVNSPRPPMLTVPDVIDNCSYREAKSRLEIRGFRLGETEFIYGERDWVYGLKVRGRFLSNGQQVSQEDVVVMQVGNGLRDESDFVTYMDADSFVQEDDDEGFPGEGGGAVRPGDVEYGHDDFEVVAE